MDSKSIVCNGKCKRKKLISKKLISAPSVEEEDGNMGKLQHQSLFRHVCKKENSIE